MSDCSFPLSPLTAAQDTQTTGPVQHLRPCIKSGIGGALQGYLVLSPLLNESGILLWQSVLWDSYCGVSAIGGRRKRYHAQRYHAQRLGEEEEIPCSEISCSEIGGRRRDIMLTDIVLRDWGKKKRYHAQRYMLSVTALPTSRMNTAPPFNIV